MPVSEAADLDFTVAGKLEVGHLIHANGGKLKESRSGQGLTWVSEVAPDRESSRTVKRSSSVLREQEAWGYGQTDRNGRLLDELASKQDHLTKK